MILALGGKRDSKIIGFCTLVFHLIQGEAIVLFHMAHLHLRAPFIMISCSLAHIQLVNLFALDQRKFPRGCFFFFFSSSTIGKSGVFTCVSEIVCLYERELVLMFGVIGLWSFHLFSLAGSEWSRVCGRKEEI